MIKVKYEDTLRRFNVPVNGDQHLDLNMEGLRLKICSLFNLPSSANFSLTYQDEDGDLVTLVDDEDLHDVVRQGLNPIRMTVCLKTDKTAQPCATFSESSTPGGSSSSSSLLNVNQNVAEVLKSVPEPLRDALSKISTELTSKATSTSPIFVDLLDSFSKMGLQYLNSSPSDCGTTHISSHAKGCYDAKENTPNEKADASIGEVAKQSDIQTSSSVQQSPERTQATKEAELIRPFPSPLSNHKGKNAISEPSSHNLSVSEGTKNKVVIENSAGKSDVYVHTINCSKGSLKKQVSSEKERNKFRLVGNRSSHFGGSSFKSFFDSNPVGECPFSGIAVPTRNTAMHEPENGYIPPPFHENFNKVDPMGSIFHKGVRCDGCGILPITGPRFKSKVKHDYDLCNVCFGRMGNNVEYSRIDFPLPYRHPWTLKGFYDHGFKNIHIPSLQVPRVRRPTGKHLHSRLDSRFIMDVNVLDGTMMAPLTPFTKIWRMRNNGTLPWNRGLLLLWIGGDRFSPSDSVEIEIPINGVNPGKEVDIAVDFIAPELPGRYISYWRMAEPSGHKFGQRVWVLIQADASMDLMLESSPELNLNLPPETTGASSSQVLDVKVEPALNFESEDLESPPMVEQRRKVEIVDLNFPINNDLLVASDMVCPTAAASSSAASGADNEVLFEASSVSVPDVIEYREFPSAPSAALYPIIDMSDGSSSSSIAKNDKNSLERDHEKSYVEETLLKELEEMGFKQVDLNKEVLRVNEYDLERSVDDLCGVSEWDPMLEELKEMGFEDKETNKKLLAKNNGSITRVVMDLIAGEK